jgi:hypothetical protein
MKMKFILMAFAAAGLISRATTALADDKVSQAEAEKIKAALEAMGCKGGEMEKQSEGNAFAFEVDDEECKDGEYDVKLDKDFKVIIMLRD